MLVTGTRCGVVRRVTAAAWSALRVDVWKGRARLVAASRERMHPMHMPTNAMAAGMRAAHLCMMGGVEVCRCCSAAAVSHSQSRAAVSL